MCGGKIADVAANVIWKILIGSGQMKVKSRHVRASPKRMMFRQRTECSKRRSTLCLTLMLRAQECLAAWRCWRRCAGPRGGCAGSQPRGGPFVDIDVSERLTVLLPDGETGLLLLDRPG